MFEKDYRLTGKHADYTRYLVKDAGLYERYIDVYMNGAVFGLLYNRFEPQDHSDTPQANILAEVFSNCRSECVFLYRLVTLLEKKTARTAEERINHAFRDDADETKAEQLKENMDVFHGYVRGGIEFMFEQLIEGGRGKDEYLEKALQFMEDFHDDLTDAPIDGKIADLLK